LAASTSIFFALGGFEKSSSHFVINEAATLLDKCTRPAASLAKTWKIPNVE
jgi:hypothetical protein